MPAKNFARGEDSKWIERTFQLALKGISGASPNPMVGCVIVRNGRAIAEGFHEKFGGPHAEINALKLARNVRGATLYSNLEPCSHWGKTPPCANSIVQAGISRVVSSMADPNPLVSGKGFGHLKKAGVQVLQGIGEPQARELNRSYIKFITEKKPYVLLKAAMSLDGKTATREGDSKWITGISARDISHKLRAEVDAILIGAETVRKDNPSLTSHGQGRNPARVVVSASGSLPARSKIFNSASRTWIFHGNPSIQAKSRGTSEWIYLKARSGRLDFKAVLSELARKGVSRLLIEGGAETLGWALDSRQVDECAFFVAPLMIGGVAAQSAIGGKGFAQLKDALKLSKVETQIIGTDVLIRARK